MTIVVIALMIVGLAAALGLAQIPVRRRVRVAFFTTGDELRAVGASEIAGDPPSHALYDSNRHKIGRAHV